ncbi:MAG: hypothetical protein PHX93_04760 [Candidatus Peribacteraceae bacterium]|nr:hypothetical protein [Candidatus Peribacteraceae bacterium]
MASATPILDSIIDRYHVSNTWHEGDPGYSQPGAETRKEMEELSARVKTGTLDKESIEASLSRLQGVRDNTSQQILLLMWLNNFGEQYDPILMERIDALRPGETEEE